MQDADNIQKLIRNELNKVNNSSFANKSDAMLQHLDSLQESYKVWRDETNPLKDQDYIDIINAYYSLDSYRPRGYAKKLGNEYGVGSGIIHVIALQNKRTRSTNVIPQEEFDQIVSAYNKKYPDTQNKIMQEVQEDRDYSVTVLKFLKQTIFVIII